MNALRQQWKQLGRKYAALSRRERLLLAAALVLGPLLIGHALLVDPQWKRGKALQNTIATESASLATMQTQAASLQQELGIDPDAGRKAELAALVAQRDQLDEQLRQLGSALVRPEEMNGLLERLLARNAGLRLISLKTLAPQSVLLRDKAQEADGKPVERSFDLYRHGVEIRLEGSYGQLQEYLAQLEKLPQRLLWGQLNYRVGEYPRAEMTLTVYTLSPDKTWLTL
ncbi:MAG: type 4a pilus biogenesis protein PilO [Gammaproteobacteria bacterium]|nr:type 4a pilus biogenesis protein PilO [Gammaproteobacteria bacterium]MBU1603439.1 type 4a pilus biogenesis protein PilO [Gammaproteobacteria bacterium]MBU2432959.1 type 4a pilus biogenesis protein PilO [Gammaproteobacteria bacterium]MBU2450202.1 type 4a pilus biogenesis protein PilO [Gammaproteobacteria bacterium]